CVCACIIWSSFSIIRVYLIRSFLLDSVLRQQFLSMHSMPIPDQQISSKPQHKLTIRHFPQHTLWKHSDFKNKTLTQQNLVEMHT
ncbi:unnamed protein product, partial [Adineta steineri]